LAAPDGPTVYHVGGVVTYTLNGASRSIVLAPATITVFPDAALHLDYFHQRDVFADDPFTEPVEPSVPYDLGLIVRNTAKGNTRKRDPRTLHIVSAQPTIVKNEKGLVIDSKIVGSEVDGKPSADALTASFGTVTAGTTHEAIWHLTSSLQGHFTDYKVTFEHE